MAFSDVQTIDIIVNGDQTRVENGLTIVTLLEHLGINPERVAVELDRQIVHQPRWSVTPIRPGAQLEIVQFVGGG